MDNQTRTRTMKHSRVDLNSMDEESRITMLGLAHLSGWSAERISQKMKTWFEASIAPGEVYMMYSQWAANTVLQAPEVEQMKELLATRPEIKFAQNPYPLTEYPGGWPTTVKFARRWNPMDLDLKNLCRFYNSNTRACTIGHFIAMVRPLDAIHELSPYEEAAVTRLGDVVSTIFANILNAWASNLRTQLQQIPSWKIIRRDIHTATVMKYIHIFDREWEAQFGMMAPYPRVTPEQFHSGTFIIQSTGQGAKILLGLMLADRSIAIDGKRNMARQEIGYVKIEGTLPEEDRACAICSDELNVPNLEGITETAIRLISCCGQVIGMKCLGSWINPNGARGQGMNNTCPHCRAPITMGFINKLWQDEDMPATEDDIESETDCDEDDDQEVEGESAGAESQDDLFLGEENAEVEIDEDGSTDVDIQGSLFIREDGAENVHAQDMFLGEDNAGVEIDEDGNVHF